MSLSASLISWAMNRLLLTAEAAERPHARSRHRLRLPPSRLTAPRGGVLMGRDRSLQCETVSKAIPLTARASRRWWGWRRPIGFKWFSYESVSNGLRSVPDRDSYF